MNATGRRSFLRSISVIAAIGAISPKAILAAPESLIPVERFDGDKWNWVRLEGGLKNAKKGMLLRFLHRDTHQWTPRQWLFEGEVAPENHAEALWFAVTVEDGRLDPESKIRGGGMVDCDWYTEAQQDDAYRAAGLS